MKSGFKYNIVDHLKVIIYTVATFWTKFIKTYDKKKVINKCINVLSGYWLVRVVDIINLIHKTFIPDRNGTKLKINIWVKYEEIYNSIIHSFYVHIFALSFPFLFALKYIFDLICEFFFGFTQTTNKHLPASFTSPFNNTNLHH